MLTYVAQFTELNVTIAAVFVNKLSLMQNIYELTLCDRPSCHKLSIY
jgi:hypothetical protein